MNVLIRLLSIMLLFAAAARGAEGFKVESTLKIGDTGKTVGMNTYFTGGKIYDIIDDAGKGEITIFDRAGDVFVLLDPACRIQTRLKASEMREKIDANRIQLLKNKDPFVVFAAKPKFDESIDETTGSMKFQSHWIDYAVETHTAGSPEMVADYFDFCDWYCYLNCRLNPWTINPLIRMEVSRALRELGRLPDKISVTVYPDGKKLLARSEKLESRHRYSLRLSEVDLKDIANAEAFVQQLRVLPFVDYQVEVGKKKPERKN
ncbi:MAG TPA: hypothetical protein DEB39_12640 [Planctomycetaceae bacterium]|nr:hypothetical protein [Planctomycetaceae bacterium]